MELKPPRELMDFKGKVALVTGANAGIGAGIARRFAEAGADVVINYRSREKEAQAVAKATRGIHGARAAAIRADVSHYGEVCAMFEEVRREFGRLDVLINNAGLYPVTPLVDMSVEEWDSVIDVNLRGAFLCTQAASKMMIEQGGGSIVNVTSIEAVNPAPGHAHYTASKSGMLMLTTTSAWELGPHGIRVNAVAPGLVNSPGLETDWPDGVKRWLARCPLGRLGEPEDVADACLFLASDAARWITGAHLVVDGGILTGQAF